MANAKQIPSNAFHELHNTYLPCFDGANSQDYGREHLAKAMIINGHGYQMAKQFKLQDSNLLTPEHLSQPYLFDVNPNFPLEAHLRAGMLPQLRHGQWTRYEKGTLVQDVSIHPWRKKEEISFAKRLLEDRQLWSALDKQAGLLYERDANAVLVVKHKGEKHYLRGQALVNYCQRLKEGLPVEGTPILFMSPKLGKIKVLNETSLSETLQASHEALGPQLVMLATCNQNGFCKKVWAEDTKPLQPIDTLFTKPQGVFNLWPNVAKPKPQEQNTMTHDAARLTL